MIKSTRQNRALQRHSRRRNQQRLRDIERSSKPEVGGLSEAFTRPMSDAYRARITADIKAQRKEDVIRMWRGAVALLLLIGMVVWWLMQ